ncbi:MAG: NUDIX domain-containing protein [Actinomycetota bacterium]|nr:NUDIX domain-containing protein [Actinomycetota bacterium]
MDPDRILATVIASLADRCPLDQREADSRERALEELSRLPRPLDRDGGPVHLTGSGVVLDSGRILLLRHRRLGIWVQPGGHLEPGEAPWDAALRESVEETGLVLEADHEPAGESVPPLLHVDVHAAADGHTHLDLRYRLSLRGDPEPCPPAGESQEVAWYDRAGAAAVADAGLSGLIASLPAEALR